MMTCFWHLADTASHVLRISSHPTRHLRSILLLTDEQQLTVIYETDRFYIWEVLTAEYCQTLHVGESVLCRSVAFPSKGQRLTSSCCNNHDNFSKVLNHTLRNTSELRYRVSSGKYTNYTISTNERGDMWDIAKESCLQIINSSYGQITSISIYGKGQIHVSSEQTVKQ